MNFLCHIKCTSKQAIWQEGNVHQKKTLAPCLQTTIIILVQEFNPESIAINDVHSWTLWLYAYQALPSLYFHSIQANTIKISQKYSSIPHVPRILMSVHISEAV